MKKQMNIILLIGLSAASSLAATRASSVESIQMPELPNLSNVLRRSCSNAVDQALCVVWFESDGVDFPCLITRSSKPFFDDGAGMLSTEMEIIARQISPNPKDIVFSVSTVMAFKRMEEKELLFRCGNIKTLRTLCNTSLVFRLERKPGQSEYVPGQLQGNEETVINLVRDGFMQKRSKYNDMCSLVRQNASSQGVFGHADTFVDYSVFASPDGRVAIVYFVHGFPGIEIDSGVFHQTAFLMLKVDGHGNVIEMNNIAEAASLFVSESSTGNNISTKGLPDIDIVLKNDSFSHALLLKGYEMTRWFAESARILKP